MITFLDVSHTIERNRKRLPVLESASFVFDVHRMGLVTGSEAQGEAIVDLIAGNHYPEQGTVRRFGRLSWPIGRLAQFRSELSGRDTLRFLTQFYGLDHRRAQDFLFDLVDFQHCYDQPIANWPRLLNVEFSYAAVLLPEFDIYLADGAIGVADDAFMRRWEPCFEQRLRGRQLILYCNQAAYLKRYCRTVAVAHQGQLVRQASVEEAFNLVTWVASDGDSDDKAPVGRESGFDDGIF
jgi:capsular polysaccharide transport system ATP-binding protein